MAVNTIDKLQFLSFNHLSCIRSIVSLRYRIFFVLDKRINLHKAFDGRYILLNLPFQRQRHIAVAELLYSVRKNWKFNLATVQPEANRKSYLASACFSDDKKSA